MNGRDRDGRHRWRWLMALAVLLAAAMSACGDRSVPVAGLRTMVVEDAIRGRWIPVDLWYPAADGAPAAPVLLGGLYRERAAVDAPVRPASPYPLIVLSHGSGGGRGDLAWLAARLARAGFVAAAIEHPGNRFGDDSPAGTVAVWRRPPDVSAVLDALLRDRVLAPWIDAARIGAAGHSSGGYTAIALGGARYDFGLLGAYCSGPQAGPDCDLAGDLDLAALTDLGHAGDSYRDARVRAVFAMAPAVGQAFGHAGLGPVDVPVTVAGAPDDELTPFALNAAHYAGLIDGARLLPVEPGGHFVFLSLCDPQGRDLAPQVCVDPDPATDRAATHLRLGSLAVDFFRSALASPPPS